MYKLLLVFLTSILHIACMEDVDIDREKTFTIRGTTLIPDPVMKKVIELERKGQITDVMIMESFPVLIRFHGTQHAMDAIESHRPK